MECGESIPSYNNDNRLTPVTTVARITVTDKVRPPSFLGPIGSLKA